ncbi:alpha/beta fold hydrolase [Halocatena pleomorpha]|uniref:Alpha/beta fold hydrolase n=1 Tax=Halocatena pleomorpha TaxID=1785090 RepID=A0A3P3R355_9EURY|nr:alpha/beta hydrolase [Halocatena pleomorpha]RRJ27891.1 alpha/beta fold hydrolase [Halocatena pleomorpha]
MPVVSTEECSLHYEARGSGPTVVFLNDVGYGAWLWGWQHPALCGPFETLVFDPRGTGQSVADEIASTVDVFAGDVERVLSAHSVRRTHLVGAGFGGAVALAYARQYDRARSLTLMGTTLNGDQVSTDALDLLGETGRHALEPCFSRAFLEQQEIVEQIQTWRGEEDAGTAAWTTQAEAWCGFSCNAPYEITLPALVLHGTDDPVVPPAAGQELATALPNGRFEALDGKHLAFIESSKPTNDEIVGFLETVERR